MSILARLLAVALLCLNAEAALAQAPAAPAASDPIVRPEGLRQVAAHSWVIPDNNVSAVANIGIIVGAKAALVVDTGMGPRNGAIVLEQAQKLAAGNPLYLVTTHVHPEHDLGAQAFPASAKLIRAQNQVRDIAETGMTVADIFRARGPINGELLKDARFRPADVTFDENYNLDLGGVTARIYAMGLNHTLGDTIVMVEQDGVLFSGDLAMTAAPSVNAKASVAGWRATLDKIAALRARIVVPSHGPIGGGELVEGYRTYFADLQTRAAALRKAGRTEDQAVAELSTAMSSRFPGAPGRIGPAVRLAYREAASQ